MKIYFAMKINQVVYKDLQKFMCYDNHVLLMVSSTSLPSASLSTVLLFNTQIAREISLWRRKISFLQTKRTNISL